MPSSHRLQATFGLAILAALMSGRTVAAPMYTITDLGSRGAWAINDRGQIISQGFNLDGRYHAFVLTPSDGTADPAAVPEPGTLAFFGLAALGLAVRRACRMNS